MRIVAWNIRAGGGKRVELIESAIVAEERVEDVLAIDEALSELEGHHGQAAELVKLRYFVGLKHQEAADVLGISRRTADRLWLLARTWLLKRLRESERTAE